MGTYISSSLTSNGAADGSTIVDTAIVKYDTNRLKNRWVLLKSGTYSGESRLISSVSTSTITPTSAFTGQVLSGVTYEILPWDPDVAHAMLQQAIRNLDRFPTSRGTRGLFRDIYDTSLVLDNLLDNPTFNASESTGAIAAFSDYDSTVEGTTKVDDEGHGLSTGDVITISGTTNYDGSFEIVVIDSRYFYIYTPYIATDTGTWVEGYGSQEGTASGWTATSGTWTFPQDQRGILGPNGRKVAKATGAATLTQDIFSKINVEDAVGKTLHIRASLLSGTASIGRIRVSFDGGSTFAASTSYHAGGGDWEGFDTHAIDEAIPSGATTATIYCDVASGGNARFRIVVAWIDGVNSYDIPTYITGGPYVVEYQAREDEADGLYLPYVPGAPSGRLLKLRGIGDLTVPTTDTQNVELSEKQAEMVVAQAAIYLTQTPANTSAGDSKEQDRQIAMWERRLATLKETSGMHLPGGDLHTYWHIEGGQLRLVR